MLIVTLIALALPQSTNTRCTTYNNVTNCQTTQPMAPAAAPEAPDYSGVFRLIRGNPEKRRAKRIGKLIAAGKCDEARVTALKAGDLPAAEYVDRSCAPQPGAGQ